MVVARIPFLANLNRSWKQAGVGHGPGRREVPAAAAPSIWIAISLDLEGQAPGGTACGGERRLLHRVGAALDRCAAGARSARRRDEGRRALVADAQRNKAVAGGGESVARWPGLPAQWSGAIGAVRPSRGGSGRRGLPARWCGGWGGLQEWARWARAWWRVGACVRGGMGGWFCSFLFVHCGVSVGSVFVATGRLWCCQNKNSC